MKKTELSYIIKRNEKRKEISRNTIKNKMKKIRTRFAPSPTGMMHVGNLRTALYEYLLAKSENGDFVLRIEDTDRERLVEGATEVIYKTLASVGLVHDEGPDVGGEFGPYVQSERMEMYKPYAEELVKKGEAYYCFCTKERLDGLHSDGSFGGYDRHCRDLSVEEIQANLTNNVPYVIRQKIPTDGSTSFSDAVYGEITIENKEIEDQVLLKSDGYPTYNFANVVDDHLMEITHVLRGSEYLTSTPKYSLLYSAFGWDEPVYVHLPLIMGKNEDGSTSKLSKRHGSTGFKDLQEDGFLPEVIINYIALLGWAPRDNREVFTLKELAESFGVEGISKSPAVFDYDKLTWLNGEYIKAMDNDTFTSYSMPYYKEIFGDKDINTDLLAEILRPRIDKFKNIPQLIHFFKDLAEYDKELFINKKSKANLDNAPLMLKSAIEKLSEVNEWTVTNIHDVLIALATELEVKNGTLLWPVRIAAAGVTVTPGGAMEILALLGKDEAISRLNKGLAKL